MYVYIIFIIHTPIPAPAEAGQAFPQGEGRALRTSPVGWFSEGAGMREAIAASRPVR